LEHANHGCKVALLCLDLKLRFFVIFEIDPGQDLGQDQNLRRALCCFEEDLSYILKNL
jgi:hypothetical protein